MAALLILLIISKAFTLWIILPGVFVLIIPGKRKKLDFMGLHLKSSFCWTCQKRYVYLFIHVSSSFLDIQAPRLQNFFYTQLN